MTGRPRPDDSRRCAVCDSLDWRRRDEWDGICPPCRRRLFEPPAGLQALANLRRLLADEERRAETTTTEEPR